MRISDEGAAAADAAEQAAVRRRTRSGGGALLSRHPLSLRDPALNRVELERTRAERRDVTGLSNSRASMRIGTGTGWRRATARASEGRHECTERPFRPRRSSSAK